MRWTESHLTLLGLDLSWPVTLLALGLAALALWRGERLRASLERLFGLRADVSRRIRRPAND